MTRPYQPPAAPRVLLVEDSLVNQRVLGGLLRKLACDVSTAGNGQEAIEKLCREEFDVVLMDVQMPIMDGLTATRLIREQEVGTEKHTRIVAVTAGMDRQSCLAAGMDDYLGKPVKAESLYEKLGFVLGAQQLRCLNPLRGVG